MSFAVTTTSYSQAAISQANKTVDVTLNGTWTIVGGEVYTDLLWRFYWSVNGGSTYSSGPVDRLGNVGVANTTGAASGAFSTTVGNPSSSFYITQPKIAADKNCAFYAEVQFNNVVVPGGGTTTKTKQGAIIYFKSWAITPTASTPLVSAITSTTATVSCLFAPNTDVSTANVYFRYRKLGVISWTTATATTPTVSGYSNLTANASLSGLIPGTKYQIELFLVRDTSNFSDTPDTFESTIVSFTTAATAIPVISTESASSVGNTFATLNGIIQPAALTTPDLTTYGFVYGTTPGGEDTEVVVDTVPSSSSSQIIFSTNLTGLTPSQTYYYKATATTFIAGTSTDYFGEEFSFIAGFNGTADRIMPSVYQFDRKYGVAVTPSSSTAINFCVEVPSATNSDKFLNAAIPWVAGDVLVDKDGGGFSNIGTLPTRIGSTQLYTLTLTATEMQATNVTVLLSDASGGPLWRDSLICIQTKKQIGQMDIDATQYGGNTTGMSIIGVGTSPGITATGGSTSTSDISGALAHHSLRRSTATAGAGSSITLDASASATNDYYKNAVIAIISGTGAGQFRTITGYTGASKVATVHTAWNTNPASGSVFVIMPSNDLLNTSPSAELSAVPSATGTYGQMLQALWTRFYHKITQTSSTQTWYKADSSTSLTTRTVSDDGVTQSETKLS